MKTLTDRQRQVLDYISSSIIDNGFPPTIREIGDWMGIKSTNGVNDHLKALERKGYLIRGNAKSRALMLTPLATALYPDRHASSEPRVVSVPLLGRIAAGVPLDAVPDVDEVLGVDPSLIGDHRDPVFALEVHGDSMIEDGIYSGDIIFVRQQSTARRGEMVAVMVDGGATVKRYYREGDRIRLEPSNAAMSPIYVSAKDAVETAILGKVVGVYRRLH